MVWSYAILCTSPKLMVFFHLLSRRSVLLQYRSSELAFAFSFREKTGEIKLKTFFSPFLSFAFSCGFVVSFASIISPKPSLKVYGIEWCLSDCRRWQEEDRHKNNYGLLSSCLELSRSDFCPIYLIYCHCSSLALLVFFPLSGSHCTENAQHKSKEKGQRRSSKPGSSMGMRRGNLKLDERWWDGDGQEEITIIPQQK